MEIVFRVALWQLRQAGGVDGANETAVAVNIAESAVESCSRESEYQADITSRLHSVGTQTEDPGTPRHDRRRDSSNRAPGGASDGYHSAVSYHATTVDVNRAGNGPRQGQKS